MKIKVKKEEIQEKLSTIQNIAEKRNTMPILSHFLFEANEKDSYIIATDIESAVKEPVDINIEKEGRICIPARKLLEIVRELEGDISIETIDDLWISIRAGKSRFKLACLSPNEFPAWPNLGDVDELYIDNDVLMEMIERTIYSAGESDTRYTLNGLLFHVKPEGNSLLVVGTDGHRLAVIDKNIEYKIKDEKRIIVPRKAVSELRRFLSGAKKSEGDKDTKVKMLIGEKHILFNIGNVEFMTRLIEGTYPNYENVIPKEEGKQMIIERETFSKVLRRVSVMSRERASAIKFEIEEGRLVVSSSNPDLGEAVEEVPVIYKHEKMVLGFNARYIIEALGAMTSEKVIFELKDPLGPVLLKEEQNEEYKCVIMPMRI